MRSVNLAPAGIPRLLDYDHPGEFRFRLHSLLRWSPTDRQISEGKLTVCFFVPPHIGIYPWSNPSMR